MAEHHGQARFDDLSKLCRHNHSYSDGDRFGRLFPKLPGLFTRPEVLHDLGLPGGPMDAGANPAQSDVAVGQVFFGQFVDHDITLDVESSIGAVNVPSDIANARTPTLDLDCVYGAGPEASPFQYHADGPFTGIKLATNQHLRAAAGLPADPAADGDLPRTAEGVALIGDFRNDENRIISQLQLAMIGAHNRFCDHHHALGLTGHDLFDAARRSLMWHYQWAVVHDFLAAMCGPELVHRVLSQGRFWYRPKVPFIPVEFSVAAYRFGHGMAPLEIEIKAGGGHKKLFEGALGNGFAPVTSTDQLVEWGKVFDVNGNTNGVQRALRCDPTMSPDLLDLVVLRADDPTTQLPGDRSLASRNLRRGQSFQLPSGEAVARHMARPETEITKVSNKADAASGNTLNGATPLWFYILTEADEIGRDGKDKGDGLGPVGATIVAEVLIGLLECDARSWLSTNRDWAPIRGLDTVGGLAAWGSGQLVIDLTDTLVPSAT